jgi:hypothetical protein
LQYLKVKFYFVVISVVTLVFSVSYAQEGPTSLIPNYVLFSSGFNMGDALDEEMGGNIFPEEVSYVDYEDWYRSLGGLVPGTMNVSGSTNITSGKLVPSPVFKVSKIFTGVPGYIDADGVTATGVGNTNNAWTDLFLKESDLNNIMYIGMNATEKPFIGAYRDYNIPDLLNPIVLGINVQGGDTEFYNSDGTTRVMVVKDSGNVGIARADSGFSSFSPTKTLHLKGGVFRITKMYGKLADFGTAKNASAVTHTPLNEGNAVEVLSSSTFNLAGGNAVFMVANVSIDMTGSTGAETGHCQMILYDSLNNVLGTSIITRFDHENVGSHSPFSTHGMVFLFKHAPGQATLTNVRIGINSSVTDGNAESFSIAAGNATVTYMIFPTL